MRKIFLWFFLIFSISIFWTSSVRAGVFDCGGVDCWCFGQKVGKVGNSCKGPDSCENLLSANKTKLGIKGTAFYDGGCQSKWGISWHEYRCKNPSYSCTRSGGTGGGGFICPAGTTKESVYSCDADPDCAGTWAPADGGKAECKSHGETCKSYETCCTRVTCVGTPKQCDDKKDNDGDGKIDYPNDLGCDSKTDDDETNYQCNDAIDNDGDGKADFPSDPGCESKEDDSEVNGECSDGVDNDGDAV